MNSVETDGQYISCQDATGFGCGPSSMMTLVLQQSSPVGGITRLSQLSGTSPNHGTPINGMIRAAEGIGRLAVAVRCNWDRLRKLALPVIAVTRNRDGRFHYVVIHEIRDANHLLIADPAKGLRSVSIQEFVQRMWTGELILVEAKE